MHALDRKELPDASETHAGADVIDRRYTQMLGGPDGINGALFACPTNSRATAVEPSSARYLPIPTTLTQVGACWMEVPQRWKKGSLTGEVGQPSQPSHESHESLRLTVVEGERAEFLSEEESARLSVASSPRCCCRVTLIGSSVPSQRSTSPQDPQA